MLPNDNSSPCSTTTQHKQSTVMHRLFFLPHVVHTVDILLLLSQKKPTPSFHPKPPATRIIIIIYLCCCVVSAAVYVNRSSSGQNLHPSWSCDAQLFTAVLYGLTVCLIVRISEARRKRAKRLVICRYWALQPVSPPGAWANRRCVLRAADFWRTDECLRVYMRSAPHMPDGSSSSSSLTLLLCWSNSNNEKKAHPDTQQQQPRSYNVAGPREHPENWGAENKYLIFIVTNAAGVVTGFRHVGAFWAFSKSMMNETTYVSSTSSASDSKRTKCGGNVSRAFSSKKEDR